MTELTVDYSVYRHTATETRIVNVDTLANLIIRRDALRNSIAMWERKVNDMRDELRKLEAEIGKQ